MGSVISTTKIPESNYEQSWNAIVQMVIDGEYDAALRGLDILDDFGEIATSAYAQYIRIRYRSRMRGRIHRYKREQQAEQAKFMSTLNPPIN